MNDLKMPEKVIETMRQLKSFMYFNPWMKWELGTSMQEQNFEDSTKQMFHYTEEYNKFQNLKQKE